MSEHTTSHLTEGDFVSSIPHPFNHVLTNRPHLEPSFLKVLDAYGNGRFEAIDEASVLANIAFIDNPANIPLVAEGYAVAQPIVRRWIDQAYDNPHLQEVIETSYVEPEEKQRLKEGTFTYQQQVLDEYFKTTIATIPEDLLTDIEQLVMDDVIEGMTNEQIMHKYNYSMTQGVVRVVKRARRKIEDQTLAPAGIHRSTRFDFETIQGKDHTHTPIATAVQDRRLPGVKFLRMWYTHDDLVTNYIKKRARMPDQKLLDQGFVLVADYLEPNSPEYDRLVKSGNFDSILKRKKLVYIRPNDLQNFLKGEIAPVYSSAPGPEFDLLVADADSESEKNRLRERARTGKIDAVKHTNGWWYINSSAREVEVFNEAAITP